MLQNEVEVIEAIHKDFDTAPERLLQEAKDILANPKVDVTLKSERVSKLGFGSARAVKIATELVHKNMAAPKLIEKINYFKQHYPFNKFITEDEVKRLCEKYGLLFGESSKYIGDIPDKNLTEIENFKLREEDFTERVPNYTDMSDLVAQYISGTQMYFTPAQERTEDIQGLWFAKPRQSGRRQWEMEYDPYAAFPKEEEKDVKKKAAAFKIVASVKDFDTTYMTITDGYRLEHIPDPVVLQPVDGGYLIVSKWGLEGQDENLVNEINN